MKKVYDEARTPYQRILASQAVDSAVKTQLSRQFVQLDPVALLQQIEKLQDVLWRHANAVPHLACDGQAGEPKMSRKERKVSPLPEAETLPEPVERSKRQYHRTKKEPIHRYWRTRQDPFADVWPEVELQLAKNPACDRQNALPLDLPTLPRQIRAGPTANAATACSRVALEAGSKTVRILQSHR